MKTLEKYRILEAGDQFRDTSGDWTPVPEKDHGIQIIFSPYTTTEVRRPSETISPDSEKPETPVIEAHKGSSAGVAAKAESDRTPAPSRSGAGESLNPENGFKGEIEKAITKAMANPLIHTIKQIKFKNPDGTYIWTGRNGTFGTYGIDLMRWHDGDVQKVSITPIGKRGCGNCVIQFPASIIPQLVEWLNANKETPK